MVSFSHPHDPFTIPRKWWDLYRDEDIPMPAIGLDEASLHPHERRRLQIADRAVQDVVARFDTRGTPKVTHFIAAAPAEDDAKTRKP